jgi:hypothetical protein
MPVLENPRHELYAHRLAKGEKEASAYAAVGYKPDDGNASKLACKVRDRVQEITGAAAERAGLSVEYVINSLIENVEMCMARKSIRIKKASKEHEGIVEIDVTKHDAAGANAALTVLGKHLGLFTEKASPPSEPPKTDWSDPQAKLKLARELLFIVAKAEHVAKQQQAAQAKIIEHQAGTRST